MSCAFVKNFGYGALPLNSIRVIPGFSKDSHSIWRHLTALSHPFGPFHAV
jgi:hypothetical protein